MSPIEDRDAYRPGRSTTQRPPKRMFSHTSQRSPMTTTDDARSLNPNRPKSPTCCWVVKDRPSKPITIGTSTRDEVAAKFGKTTSVRFDSGFEVWVYRLPGEPGDKAGAARSGPDEYVVLFTPSGVVAKTRFRPAPTGSGGAEGR